MLLNGYPFFVFYVEQRESFTIFEDMNWVRSFGTFEVVITIIFILFYLAYIFRVIGIARTINTSYSKVFIKVLLRTVYFSLLMVALLGPSYGESRREIKAVGKDIFLCVDLSQSMNAHDIQPTRLEKIKFELKKVISAFSSDRLGLIIFSSEAFMQCPLTYDQNALNMFVEILNSDLVPDAGTDFGPPLKMALEKINADQKTVTQQKSKIIVLISDGEDFGENTESVVDDIESEGIKLFTLGVGTKKGSRIKTKSGFKKDKNNNVVVTKLSTRSLMKLADDTNGKYFEISDNDNDVERLISAINNIEGEVRDVKQVDASTNKYFYFLFAAAILMGFDLLLSLTVIKI